MKENCRENPSLRSEYTDTEKKLLERYAALTGIASPESPVEHEGFLEKVNTAARFEPSIQTLLFNTSWQLEHLDTFQKEAISPTVTDDCADIVYKSEKYHLHGPYEGQKRYLAYLAAAKYEPAVVLWNRFMEHAGTYRDLTYMASVLEHRLGKPPGKTIQTPEQRERKEDRVSMANRVAQLIEHALSGTEFDQEGWLHVQENVRKIARLFPFARFDALNKQDLSDAMDQTETASFIDTLSQLRKRDPSTDMPNVLVDMLMALHDEPLAVASQQQLLERVNEGKISLSTLTHGEIAYILALDVEYHTSPDTAKRQRSVAMEQLVDELHKNGFWFISFSLSESHDEHRYHGTLGIRNEGDQTHVFFDPCPFHTPHIDEHFVEAVAALHVASTETSVPLQPKVSKADSRLFVSLLPLPSSPNELQESTESHVTPKKSLSFIHPHQQDHVHEVPKRMTHIPDQLSQNVTHGVQSGITTDLQKSVKAVDTISGTVTPREHEIGQRSVRSEYTIKYTISTENPHKHAVQAVQKSESLSHKQSEPFVSIHTNISDAITQPTHSVPERMNDIPGGKKTESNVSINGLERSQPSNAITMVHSDNGISIPITVHSEQTIDLQLPVKEETTALSSALQAAIRHMENEKHVQIRIASDTIAPIELEQGTQERSEETRRDVQQQKQDAVKNVPNVVKQRATTHKHMASAHAHYATFENPEYIKSIMEEVLATQLTM